MQTPLCTGPSKGQEVAHVGCVYTVEGMGWGARTRGSRAVMKADIDVEWRMKLQPEHECSTATDS